MFEYKQEIKRRELLAADHYNRSLNRRLWTEWRKQTTRFKATNRHVEACFVNKQRQRCGELFSAWRTRVTESRLERESEQLASAFRLKRVMTNVIVEWHKYAKYRRERHQRDEQMLIEYRCAERKLLVTAYFRVWAEKTDVRIVEAGKHRLAQGFYENKLRNQMYSNWRFYVAQCRHERMLERQANLFVEMRLKTEVFFTWHSRYKQECEMRERNMNALLLWSLNVQRKYLTAWIDWCRARKVC